MTPTSVRPVMIVGESSLCEVAVPPILARPKSSTFTVPSGLILMLPGFRSRWVTPFSCAASSASAIWRAMDSASSRGIGPSTQPLSEGRPLDQLHDEIVRADIVEVADVGVAESRDGPPLALEPLGELLGGDLDGHVPIEARIPRPVHLSHAAFSERRQDLVGTGSVVSSVMSIIVQKSGGSSVADVGKLRYVAERVMQTARRGHQVVVVVSAMGDTTDELLAMAKQLSPNPERRELDMLLSAGERISMALLSLAIRELGGDAISFTGSQSGIITNDRHVDARIIEVRPFRVQDELARGRIVVVAGYQGVSYKREVTTLGRGGSDTTAVAMAAALDAEYVRFARTWMACTPPIRVSCRRPGGLTRCPTRRRRKWPRPVRRS